MDGGKGTNYKFCAHTGDQGNTNPWWRVDLGRVEHVAEVNILNRDSFPRRLDGAEIRVGQWYMILLHPFYNQQHAIIIIIYTSDINNYCMVLCKSNASKM